MPGFWGYAVLSSVIFLAIELIALVPSILMQQVIDRFIPNRQTDKIILLDEVTANIDRDSEEEIKTYCFI